MKNPRQTNTDRILNEWYIIASTDSRGYSVFLRIEYEDIIDKYDLNCYAYEYKDYIDKGIFLLFDYNIIYSRTLLLSTREDAERILAKIKKIYNKSEDTVADFTEIDKKNRNRYKEYSISYDNLHIEKVSISIKRIE